MIFNCLKDKLEMDKEVMVWDGMELKVRKIRYSENENGKRKREFFYFPAKIISTNHSKFYLIEINSKTHSYKETISKKDFQNKISDNTLIL